MKIIDLEQHELSLSQMANGLSSLGNPIGPKAGSSPRSDACIYFGSVAAAAVEASVRETTLWCVESARLPAVQSIALGRRALDKHGHCSDPSHLRWELESCWQRQAVVKRLWSMSVDLTARMPNGIADAGALRDWTAKAGQLCKEPGQREAADVGMPSSPGCDTVAPGSRPCDFNAVINLGAGKRTRDQLPRFLPIFPVILFYLPLL
jgi:hypothetical protein